MRESKDAMMGWRVRSRVACALAFLAVTGCSQHGEGERPDSAAAPEASLAGLEAVARAFPPVGERPLNWPSDHAPHPEHFTESWHLAGLLRDEDGRRYGFQLLLQRVALQAEASGRDSAWAAGAVWQGIFSLEPEGAARVSAERYSREALGLAGADADMPAAWLEDWRIEMQPETGTAQVLGAAAGARLELSLRLPRAPPAATAAEARRGYWWPGLETSGALELDGRALEVRGSALLDRSWGQAPPAGRGQLALARLWVRDDAGAALRCEQLRRRGGGGVPLGGCSDYASGRALSWSPEPTEAAAAALRRGRAPLEWRLPGPGAGEAERWAPLAQADNPGPAWSGVIVPAGEVAADERWGLLSLSNFTAP